MAVSWHEWLCHSNFSFCIGASHPEEYVLRAASLGYAGLGLSDYDGVYGLVRAFRQHSLCEQSLQLYYGAEIHLQADHQRPLVFRDTLVLYARDLAGYQQLCRVLSLAHKTNKTTAVISLDTLAELPTQDLICLQPMRGLIRRSPAPVVYERYAKMRDIFANRCYLLLSRHLNPIEDAWIPPTLRLSQQLGLPCLFSQDAYFHEPASKEISDVLQAIRLNETIDQVITHLFVNSERCLQPLPLLEQRYRCFADYAAIVQNSAELAAQFSFSLAQLRYHYPREFIPAGYSTQTYLEEVTWHAAATRYAGAPPPAIIQLIDRELKLILELGFADYFLTVWDIVVWARSQQILCQGRGSAANSAVCYVLGITSVNPAKFDIIFERFISRERGDPPDIDVDFEHERREEVIQYIYGRYGRHRAAMVANVITFRSRSALRCVGKALGIADAYLQEAAAELRLDSAATPPQPHAELPAPASGALSPLSQELWQRLAARIKGFPHHMGIHSGGFVVSDQPLDTICPQEPATMADRTVIQWSKDDIEHLNIFKIDVLALGMLTVLRKAMHMIEQQSGLHLELSTIPDEDAATYRMIQRADTVGTFQIESRAQMSMLPRLRPRTFYDLVIQIGIIRPGPIQGGLIHPFLRRRQGLEPVSYADPRLKPILQRTLGVPIFQEQVMRIAITVGAFSAGEADQLRKHIGAWSLNKEWGPLVDKLEEGMRRNGLQEQFVQEILGHLKGFASYGFPESHAISFALIAYASAYLKCHHQEAFYTALLNSQPVGFYSIHALVHSARREGTSFLPIDIRCSDWDSKLELYQRESGEKIWAVRLGLRLVSGLTESGGTQIQLARSQQGARTLKDFLRSTTLSRRDLGALAAADALAGLGLSRAHALWLAEGLPYAPLLDEEEAFCFGPEDEIERLERDFDSFATTLGEHPSKVLRERHWSYELLPRLITRAHDLRLLPAKRRVHVFGLVLVRQAPMTAKGMLFFTLEDETGYINLVFTPQKVARFQRIIQQQGFICATGTLQRQAEGHSILVEQVHSPRPPAPNTVPLRAETKPKPAAAPAPISKLPRARNYH